MTPPPTVLITGASAGIGEVYADRFARRGHDLVLVARSQDRLAAVADRLRSKHRVKVDTIRADLTDPADLTAVEDRLRTDDRIGVLVSNAGESAPGEFIKLDPARAAQLIALNALAPTRLAAAAAPRMTAAGQGAIVNVGSAVGLMPDYGQAVYGATKAYVLFLSQSLHHELAPSGVYVQAVLPAAVRTSIFEKSGRDVDSIPGLMDPGDLVDAALVGYDRREAVTIPALPEEALWTDLDAARGALAATLRQSQPAARYRDG